MSPPRMYHFLLHYVNNPRCITIYRLMSIPKVFHYLLLTVTTPRCITIYRLMLPPHEVSVFTAYC